MHTYLKHLHKIKFIYTYIHTCIHVERASWARYFKHGSLEGGPVWSAGWGKSAHCAVHWGCAGYECIDVCTYVCKLFKCMFWCSYSFVHMHVFVCHVYMHTTKSTWEMCPHCVDYRRCPCQVVHHTYTHTTCVRMHTYICIVIYTYMPRYICIYTYIYRRKGSWLLRGKWREDAGFGSNGAKPRYLSITSIIHHTCINCSWQLRHMCVCMYIYIYIYIYNFGS
jgi:hypothetical protein